MPVLGGDSERLPGASTESAEAALRFSLAGVQLKLSAALKADGGLTIPATGIGGAWILKLPASRMMALPENEFAMMTLAKKVGIPVPPVRLISLDDVSGLPREMHKWAGQALAIRRFDRPEKGRRVHMEDFAQVFGQSTLYRRFHTSRTMALRWGLAEARVSAASTGLESSDSRGRPDSRSGRCCPCAATPWREPRRLGRSMITESCSPGRLTSGFRR